MSTINKMNFKNLDSHSLFSLKHGLDLALENSKSKYSNFNIDEIKTLIRTFDNLSYGNLRRLEDKVTLLDLIYKHSENLRFLGAKDINLPIGKINLFNSNNYYTTYLLEQLNLDNSSFLRDIKVFNGELSTVYTDDTLDIIKNFNLSDSTTISLNCLINNESEKYLYEFIDNTMSLLYFSVNSYCTSYVYEFSDDDILSFIDWTVCKNKLDLLEKVLFKYILDLFLFIDIHLLSNYDFMPLILPCKTDTKYNHELFILLSKKESPSYYYDDTDPLTSSSSVPYILSDLIESKVIINEYLRS